MTGSVGAHGQRAAVPRYRSQTGPALLSAGFRPFFLASALWAAVAIPLWIAAFAGDGALPAAMPPAVWHVHEMVFGFGAATVAGFLLTAIPNWTGRLPLQGGPLAALVLLWAVGRAATFFGASIGPAAATVCDLAFPTVFVAVVAREIAAGRNWRNLPMVAALLSLLTGNALVHAQALGWAATADTGNRLGIATLLMLISLVGGRIIPSFTRNWLVKQHPGVRTPAAFNPLDSAVLAAAAAALIAWTIAPEASVTDGLCLVAGLGQCVRVARWRGLATLREPLLWILHLGYAWLGIGLLLLGMTAFVPVLPQSAALHALTVGAVGTMTLAVMTRATLGHTGRPLTAGPGTTAIYALVTLAAVARLLAPLGESHEMLLLSLAGGAWSSAFGLFALLYLRPLAFWRAGKAVPTGGPGEARGAT